MLSKDPCCRLHLPLLSQTFLPGGNVPASLLGQHTASEHIQLPKITAKLDIKRIKINITYIFNLTLQQGCKSLFTLLNSDPYPTSIKKSYKEGNRFFELEQLAKAGDLNCLLACCVIGSASDEFHYLDGAGGRIYLGIINELRHMCIVGANAMIGVFQ
jgi:hypothetical protein